MKKRSKALRRALKVIPLRQAEPLTVGQRATRDMLALAAPLLVQSMSVGRSSFLDAMYGEVGPPPHVPSRKRTPGKSMALRRARHAQAVANRVNWQLSYDAMRAARPAMPSTIRIRRPVHYDVRADAEGRAT